MLRLFAFVLNPSSLTSVSHSQLNNTHLQFTLICARFFYFIHYPSYALALNWSQIYKLTFVFYPGIRVVNLRIPFQSKLANRKCLWTDKTRGVTFNLIFFFIICFSSFPFFSSHMRWQDHILPLLCAHPLHVMLRCPTDIIRTVIIACYGSFFYLLPLSKFFPYLWDSLTCIHHVCMTLQACGSGCSVQATRTPHHIKLNGCDVVPSHLPSQSW